MILNISGVDSIITMYGIRLKGTKNFLPARSTHRGHTFDEPELPSKKNPPRLFGSEHAAKLALTAWVKGKWYSSRGQDPTSGEYYEDTEIEPTPHRKREDMEIVPIILTA